MDELAIALGVPPARLILTANSTFLPALQRALNTPSRGDKKQNLQQATQLAHSIEATIATLLHEKCSSTIERNKRFNETPVHLSLEDGNKELDELQVTKTTLASLRARDLTETQMASFDRMETLLQQLMIHFRIT